MTWTKLDDGFWSHRKILAVGNAAAGAYCRMLAYCGNQLTDGHIPDDIANFIATRPQLVKLEGQTLIERNGSGWQIPDYLDFNPTRQKVEGERRRASERMAKLRGNVR